MNNPNELTHALANFYGTEGYYRHNLNRSMLYTDGVQFFAENAGGGAYWLLDIIATEVMSLHKKEEFIHVIYTVTGSTGQIVATDGNEHTLFKRGIDYTDCPEGKWEFYLVNNTLMIPSEY